jgi:hypothetical protein
LDQIRQLKENLIAELELSHDEVEIFMSLIKAEKTSSNNFIIQSKYTKEETIEICKELEQKGMIIEISNNEFQGLHPRFAIVNRYKRMCKEKGAEFKKNTKIDNIGLMLEKYQNKND